MPGTCNWDASIGWRNTHWDIKLWGKNLTDETYLNISSADLFGSTFANPALGGDLHFNVASPL